MAAALAGQVKAGRTWVHLASSERRAEEIGRALAGLAPDIETLVLPPWDCLPYDRASPSRDVMGRRMRVFQRLAEKAAGRRVLVVSPEALMQRLPPAEALSRAFLRLERGRPLDRAGLIGFARRSGYVWDDRIDEPGEIAALGEVIDIFPAEALRPVRLAVAADGVLGDIRIYDPLTQRSEEAVESLDLGPASELIEEDAADEHETEAFEPRVSGAEHRLPLAYQTLRTLFDLLPKAALSQDPKAGERLVRAQEQVQEAYEARTALGLDAETTLRPAGLYLPIEDCAAGVDAWTAKRLPLRGVTPGQRLATAANPGRAFCDLVDAARRRGDRVVLSGLAHELRALNKALRRGLDTTAEPAADWSAALAGPAGAVLALEADLEAGFIDGDMVVIAASDVLGGRLAERKSATLDLLAQADLRIGDVVLHEDHGVGVLRDLTVVEVDGAARDSLQIEYHGGASILTPVDDIGRVWRYGAEEAAVTLDRLKGDGWFKRRAEVSRHVEAAAVELVALAKAREAATCEPIQPPKGPYARFAVRFAYPETQDQGAAIAEVLSDLASGRPMDRLVCGDVGFGKTEVALRAAAAVALSGRQVAVAAPTTVLARQHFQTFQKRFAGTGVKVAQLSRVVGTAEAKAVRAGLASGEIGLVIGTHALASEGVDFANLGLVIIDEEQKFGSAMKERLRGLARDGHRLTLTATPIPRTLQAAMVGVQDVSVIATPPARRRPIRTFLAPFDAATVRTALLREKRRAGQSFVVVPRIEDIEPLRETLAQLTPELSVRIAHGGLDPEESDSVMVGFADGDGDILLATNIIESGLDVPRANTMIIWRPDRFGLSQLHQLRGRVGRGRAQGIAYLLTEPDSDLAEATRARLSTLEAFDRLGSGLAISARDLDLRGGGDLVGEEQAGHMRMIGSALYQRLLEAAIRTARGDTAGGEWTPVLNLGRAGLIPADYVPDAVTRINLYARLSRMETPAEIDDFEEELSDRFGALPDETARLLGEARLSRLAKSVGVRRISTGPKGAVIELADRSAGDTNGKLVLPPGLGLPDLERVLLRLGGSSPSDGASARVADRRNRADEVPRPGL